MVNEIYTEGEFRASVVGGHIGRASEVSTANGSNVESRLSEVNDIIQQLLNQVTVTGRGFQRRNDNSIEIDNTNLAQFNEVNTIYAAGIDKTVTWTLPSEADIAATASVDYPVVMEFTHLGGTTRLPSSGGNRVNLDVDPADVLSGVRIRVEGGLMNLTGIDLLRDDVVVISKEGAGQDWVVNRSLHDPATRILPSGTWEFHGTNHLINSINNISTELNGVAVNAGDVFLVETGGEYFDRTIGNRALIVSLIDNPGLATTNGDDWYIINNGDSVLSNDQIYILSQFTRSGSRVDATRNFFVNESNVIAFNSQASPTPANTLSYFNSNTDGSPGQFNVSTTFTLPSVSFRFGDLQGGALSLNLNLAISRSEGFLPELNFITLNYGSVVFTFPLNGISPEAGNTTINVNIPSNDYSAILNTDPTVTINYNFRGVLFIGSIQILSVTNTLNGTLRLAVTNIANNAALMSERRTTSTINGLAERIDDENSALGAISDRISPYKQLRTRTPDINARFLDSTGSDSFPNDLNTMTAVNTANPRFTAGNTAMYVAVIGGANYTLKNITASSELSLVASEATVTLGESRTFSGNTYFVYRVTGIVNGNVYEVDRVTNEQVVAWPDDISNLQGDIDRIDAELSHAALNLPDALVNVLDNEVTVTEQTNATQVATDYNRGLAAPTNTQKVFLEANPNSPSGGGVNSKPINETSGARARRKLVYIPQGTTYANQAYLTAFDGTTGRDLIRYTNGVFNAQVFVPAQAAATVTSTIYPAPSNRVSGAGIWINIPTLTFTNGVPVTEADEVFFSRNVPPASTPITVQYRGHANGNIFGTATTTLAANQNVATVVLNDGSESATLEIRRWQGNQIRVSVTEHVNTGLPTINDVEVILSYTESRTVPSTPATTREVAIENVSTDSDQIFAIKPSSTNTLIIVGGLTEIDTGFLYTTLFGASETGFLTVFPTTGRFYDYENFNPITRTIIDLENHSTLPQDGLFETTYTHATIVELGTQFIVSDNAGNRYNVGEALRALNANTL